MIINNSKERGYIFQDAFSAYIIADKLNMLFEGKQTKIEVVLDKKRNEKDKFDDLKIIENAEYMEIQVKYSESKDKLGWSDLKNASSDYNIYQYINSYKTTNSKNCILLVRNTTGSIEKELSKKIQIIDCPKLLDNSTIYKLKSEDSIIEELYNSRRINSEKAKQPYLEINKEDIKEFISFFRIEVTNISLTNNDIKELVLSKFDNDLIKMTGVPRDFVYDGLKNIIRKYRAEDNYVVKEITDIGNELIKKLDISKYITPVSNELFIDDKIEIKRKEDVENVISLLEDNNMIYIYGEPGTGKSWLANQIKNKLEKNSAVSSYYFYFNNEDSDREKRTNRINFYTTINYQLQQKHGYNINLFSNNIDNIIEKINESNEKHYIILDGVDHINRENSEQKIVISEMINKFKRIADETSNMKIIVLSQPIEEINIDCRYRLNNLSKEETNKLIDNYITKYNVKEDIKQKEIYSKSKGNPLIINYLVKGYAENELIPETNFNNIDEYYDYIFNGTHYAVYSYFGILPFPVSEVELAEISKINVLHVREEIKAIKNVLRVNNKNEYIAFHESLKRYIANKEDVETNELINKTVKWLLKQDIYENEKAFNYLPEIIVNQKLYDSYDKEYDINKLINLILEKGISNNEIKKFNLYCYKIYLNNRNFKQIYYIEHFNDMFETFKYEVDIDVLEDYIKILYLRGKTELIENILYKRGIIEYENFNQQCESIINICVYLLKNKVKLNYEDIVNIYFENIGKEKTIKINNVFIAKSEEKFIIEYMNVYEENDKIFNQLKEQDEEFAIYIDNIYKNKFNGYNSDFTKYRVLLPDKKISFEDMIERYSGKEYIDSIDGNVLLYFFNTYTTWSIDSLQNEWNEKYKVIPNYYLLVITLLKLLSKTDLSEKEIDDYFDNFNYEQLEFSGYLFDSKLDFIGNIIIRSEKKNYFIKKYIDFKNKIRSQKTSRKNEGIVSVLRSIYLSIINNVKNNNIKLANDVRNLLKYEYNPNESNSSNLRTEMTNYILDKINDIDDEKKIDFIKQLMFSYGSNRDIQIWELEDIYSRLKRNNKLTPEKFWNLYEIAFNAIERMDRAKDVWQVLNNLLEMYASDYSAIDAIKILFNTHNQTGFLRDDDVLFSHIYEKIKLKDYNENIFYYNYWRYIKQNIKYAIYNKDSYLKRCIRYANNDRYNYFKFEILNSLDEYSEAEKNEIELLLQDKNKLLEFEKNIRFGEEKEKEVYVDNLYELVEKNNDRKININSLSYKSICKIIDNLPTIKEIKKLMLSINTPSYINNIYDTLKDNNYTFNDNKRLICFCIGLYYRGNLNVSNMQQDEIFEECLKLNDKFAKEMLIDYMIEDEKVEIGRKSGKIYKYLVDDSDIEEIYNQTINLYYDRLPYIKRIDRNISYNIGDKNDILLNYLIMKIDNDYRSNDQSLTEALIFSKLFDIKRDNLFFIKDKETIENVLEIYEYVISNLYLMLEGFLKWNYVDKNTIKYEMDRSKYKMNLILNNCEKDLKNILLESKNGFLLLECEKYKYKAYMIQVFDIYGSIEDRNLKNRMYRVEKSNMINLIKCTIRDKKRSNKIKRLYRDILL